MDSENINKNINSSATTVDTDGKCEGGASGTFKEKFTGGRLSQFFLGITAVCSVFSFILLLIIACILVPKALNLMSTAQTTLNNLETVSEDLMSLQLAETVKSIDDNVSQAMEDVSTSMEQIQSLDIETLNQSIQDLKEATESFKKLFSW